MDRTSRRRIGMGLFVAVSVLAATGAVLADPPSSIPASSVSPIIVTDESRRVRIPPFDADFVEAAEDGEASTWGVRWTLLTPGEESADPAIAASSRSARVRRWRDPVSGGWWTADPAAVFLRKGAVVSLPAESVLVTYVRRLYSTDFTPVEIYGEAATMPNTGNSLGFAGRFPVVLSFIAEDTRRPLDRVGVVLFRADGLPLGPSDAGLTRRTDDTGRLTYSYLRPGSYWIEARREAARPDRPEYVTRQGRIEVKVAAPSNEQTVPLYPRRLSQRELEERWSYVVEGVVRDHLGNPLPGTDVRAVCGPVFRDGPADQRFPRQWLAMVEQAQTPGVPGVVTGLDGTYSLRLGFADDGIDHRIVIIAHRAGYYEEGLCEAGRYIVSRRPSIKTSRGDDNLNLRPLHPGEAGHLDFVMRPGVTIKGRYWKQAGQVGASVSHWHAPHAVMFRWMRSGIAQDIGGCDIERGSGYFEVYDLPCGVLEFIGSDHTVKGTQEFGTAEFSEPGEYEIALVRTGGSSGGSKVDILRYTPATRPAGQSKPMR